jgi:hypothetical protein
MGDGGVKMRYFLGKEKEKGQKPKGTGQVNTKGEKKEEKSCNFSVQ